MNGAESLLRTAAASGIRICFANPGTTELPLVAAFEIVGSILVIATLIVPAATASILTDRLSRMIVIALVVAAASALLGHVMAITLPSIIFSRLGFDSVVDHICQSVCLT